ncbi:MAG: FAD-dependent oxidoreductase [Lentisphaeria bacterium]|nr:FAD-dependent oxidoreductase [Lentisphaeria bacterium]
MLGGLRRDGAHWAAVLCEKDGLREIRVRCVIDCTGDANAVVQAGGEVNIPPECQPGSSSVICTGIDRTRLEPETMKRNFEKELAAGNIRPEDLGWWHGYSDLFLKRSGTNANHICHINGGDSRSRSAMEIEGRLSLLRSYRFLKRQPGCEKLHMIYAGPECGVRESRTIVGDVTVTDEAYRTGRAAKEPVAYAFYPLDLHDAEAGLLNTPLAPGALPTVPRGALIPKGLEGILAAGRIISGTRGANAGLRVQAVCMATGQAAGAWAALSVKSQMPLRAISYRSLYEELLANKAVLPPCGN